MQCILWLTFDFWINNDRGVFHFKIWFQSIITFVILYALPSADSFEVRYRSVACCCIYSILHNVSAPVDLRLIKNIIWNVHDLKRTNILIDISDVIDNNFFSITISKLSEKLNCQEENTGAKNILMKLDRSENTVSNYELSKNFVIM